MRMKTFLAGALLSALTTLAADSSNWRSLPLIKNEKVDTNWVHIGYGKFIVEEGTIRTDPAADGLGLLVFKKEKFGDCQLKVVFKPKEAHSNSGFYVRLDDGILQQVDNPGAKFVRDGTGTITEASSKLMQASGEEEDGIWYGVHRGYEIQIAGGGDPLHGTGAIYSLANTKAKKKDGGEWRTMIVTLLGNQITVDLDGERVTTFDSEAKNLPKRKIWYEPKRENKRPQKGYIGLQTHDPGDIVWFKEISVRPIGNEAAATPKKIKPASTTAE